MFDFRIFRYQRYQGTVFVPCSQLHSSTRKTDCQTVTCKTVGGFATAIENVLFLDYQKKQLQSSFVIPAFADCLKTSCKLLCLIWSFIRFGQHC